MEKEAPFFRTEYNYDMNIVTEQTALVCKDPSRTRQEFAEDADLNVIVARFGIGHEMPQNVTPPMSGDFSAVPDYRGAQDLLRKANEVFGNLPAKVRSRFDNDPAQYIDFLENPDNEAEAIALGLASKPAPVDTPPDPQPAPGAPKPA